MARVAPFKLSERFGTRVLLTAEEAFPALERAFLGARREIWGSFRVFDLRTRLRSREGRALGDTWFDLLVHVLGRRVRVRMVLADFDPMARPWLHRATWASARQFLAAAELAGPGADLDLVPAMHPARTGVLPRLLVWPVVQARLGQTVARLNRMTAEDRAAHLRDMPGLLPHLWRRGDGRIAPRRWHLPELCPATHHQKLAVFDRRLLYIGGLDLDERRYDDKRHLRPGGETWQDVTLLTDGPAVPEAQSHLERFPAVVAGRGDPPTPQRRLIRTLSRRRRDEATHFGPEPVAHEIARAHDKYCREARRLIYLETQFLRDRRFARMLAEAGRANPALMLLVMLPAAPEDLAFEASGGADARLGEFLQWRCLRILHRAFRDRLFVGAGAQPRRPKTPAARTRRDRLRGAELVYIHSKVSIFDTDAAIVSSANLNGRSLRWDTEAGLLLDDADTVATLRRRIFRHWLPDGAGPRFHDPDTALSAWRDLAARNAGRPPEAREGFILPYDFRVAAGGAMPLPGIPEAMV